MDVTIATWIVGLAGLLLMGLLFSMQFIAVLRPRAQWTIENVYGGEPESTDPKAYFAFNQGTAWADTMLLGPLQLAGSVGMLLGERWGFLLALVGSVPFLYTGVTFYIWDRDLKFRKNSFNYWVVIWGMWPLFGAAELTYCLARLL